MKSRFLWILLLILSLAVLAACGGRETSSGGGSASGGSSSSQGDSGSSDAGGSDGGSDGGSESQEAPLEMTRLVVGSSVRDIGFLNLYVADAKGFFEEEGLDVEVQYFNSGSQHVQALAADAIHIGSGAFTEPIDAYVSQQPIKAFWGVSNYPVYEWWASPDLKTLDDVRAKGKVKVAVSRVGSLSHLISVFAFEKSGLTPVDQYAEFVGLGGPGARLAGLQSGQVDMIPATIPGNYILEKDGFNPLILLKDLIEEFQYEVFYAKDKILKENPNTIRAFLRAVSRASEYIGDNAEESAKILSEIVGYKPEELEDVTRGVEEMAPYFPVDGHFAEEGVKVLLQFYKDSGDLQEIPAHEEIIDYTFTNEFQGK